VALNHHFLRPFNLGLLGLMAGLLACANPYPETDTPESSNPSPERAETTAQPPLTDAELAQAEADLQEDIRVNLDLLGVGAVNIPTTPEGMAEYRQAWAAVQPEIAPFLGTWTHLNDLQPDQLVVFPSAVENQICVVDFQTRYQYELPADADDFTRATTAPADEMSLFTSLRVSVVDVKDGQAQSSRLRFHEALVKPTTATWAPLSFEFLGVVEPTDRALLYAAYSAPEIDPFWPTEVAEQLAEYQCQTGLPE
jgi:hypothetical protein